MRKPMILKLAVLDRKPVKGDLVRGQLSGMLLVVSGDPSKLPDGWEVVEPYGMDEEGNIELKPSDFDYGTLSNYELKEDSRFIVLYDERLKLYAKNFFGKSSIYKF